MPRSRLLPMMAATSAALLSTLLGGAAASAAASVDRTPPTAPFLAYAQGFQCLTVILGAQRSTDDVTPQSELRYEAFAEGAFIGLLSDRGHPSGPWGVLRLPRPGPNSVVVQAVDAAGNRSPQSTTRVVTGFFTPGCTPGRIG